MTVESVTATTPQKIYGSLADKLGYVADIELREPLLQSQRKFIVDAIFISDMSVANSIHISSIYMYVCVYKHIYVIM